MRPRSPRTTWNRQDRVLGALPSPEAAREQITEADVEARLGPRLPIIAATAQPDNDARTLANLDIQTAEQLFRLVDRFLVGIKIQYKRINSLMAGVKSVIRHRHAPPLAEPRCEALVGGNDEKATSAARV